MGIANEELLNDSEYLSFLPLSSLGEEDSKKKKMTKKQFNRYWAFLLTDLSKRKTESEDLVKKLSSEYKDESKKLKELQELYDEVCSAYNYYIDLVCNFIETGFAERKKINQFEEALKDAETKYITFLNASKSQTETFAKSLSAHAMIKGNFQTIVADPNILKGLVGAVMEAVNWIVDKVNEIQEKKKKAFIEQLSSQKWLTWLQISIS